MKIVAWQNMLSPHQAPLLQSLAASEQVEELLLIVEESLSRERAEMGWQVPDMQGVRIMVAPSETQLDNSLGDPQEYVHLVSGFCQGRYGKWIRRNVNELYLYTELAKSKTPIRYLINKMRYRWFYWRIRQKVKGIFAIGSLCPDWLVETLGISRELVLPFGYFLSSNTEPEAQGESKDRGVLFVGRMEPVKGILPFVQAYREQEQSWAFNLVGDGSLADDIRTLADGNNNLVCSGSLPRDKILSMIGQYRLLVLPNVEEEGWGFVVNEALMQGTPVFCTDKTGARKAVENAPFCQVFSHRDLSVMIRAVQTFVATDYSPEQRLELVHWYNDSLSVEAATRYMLDAFTENSENKKKKHYGWL